MTEPKIDGASAKRPIAPISVASMDSGSSLLPMLVGGLVMIVIGAIVVMAFV